MGASGHRIRGDPMKRNYKVRTWGYFNGVVSPDRVYGAGGWHEAKYANGGKGFWVSL